MRSILLVLALFAVAAVAQNDGAAKWQEEIAQGFVPYHQLTLEDFRVDDSKSKKDDFSFQSFIHPRYEVRAVTTDVGSEAVIENWRIFSGLDKNGSFRRGNYKKMGAMLPYVQAFLDLTEIQARELAALSPDQLPRTRATSFFDAKTEVDAAVKKLVAERFAKINAEAEALTRETKKGEDTKKVQAMAAEIRKRLEATPAKTVPYSP